MTEQCSLAAIQLRLQQRFDTEDDKTQLDLDSLAIVEVVAIIESVIAVDFPEEELQLENFRDIETIQRMVLRIVRRAP